MFRIVRRLMRNDLRFALRLSEVLLQKRKFDWIIWWHRTHEWSHWTFITIEGELKFTHTQMQARVCVLGPFGKWLFILSNLAVRHFVCSDFYAHATDKSCGYFKSKNDIKQEKKRTRHVWKQALNFPPKSENRAQRSRHILLRSR